MNIEELNQKYENFLKHENFPKLESSAEFILQHPDLDEINRKAGNWTYNLAFLRAYFEMPKVVGLLVQTPYRFTIIHNGIPINLDTNEAPNFRDQEAYLKWLHQQISK